MLLPDFQIENLVKQGKIKISPYHTSRIQPASYDLALGAQLCVYAGENYTLVNLSGPYTLSPGEFVLAHTNERFSLPADIAARVEGKSSLGRLGLVIHATAGFIDPGFQGQITLELSNVSWRPIQIAPRMLIAQICFMPLAAPAKRPYGSAGLGSHYQGQLGPTPSALTNRNKLK